MLFINIMFLGGVSGGHFNPAVTAAVYIKDLQENPSKMI
jgi:glycerol uptake facilitator-like aquaporin